MEEQEGYGVLADMQRDVTRGVLQKGVGRAQRHRAGLKPIGSVTPNWALRLRAPKLG